MAWTAPMTAVANSVFTAAQFNLFVRDNLLETGPAKATTAHRFIVTDGVNSIAERAVGTSQVDSVDTVTGTSFAAPPDGLGPIVTVTTGSQALVWFQMQAGNTGATQVTKMSLSDIGNLAPGDATALTITAPVGAVSRSCVAHHIFNLTPGPNVFSAVYRVTGGTGTISMRRLLVIPL